MAGPAAVVGAIFGLAGLRHRLPAVPALQRAEGTSPFSISDLVGRGWIVR